MDKRNEKKSQHSTSTVLAELLSIQLERKKGGVVKKETRSMSWQWAGHRGGATGSSLSLAALTGPGLPSGVNLRLAN